MYGLWANKYGWFAKRGGFTLQLDDMVCLDSEMDAQEFVLEMDLGDLVKIVRIVEVAPWPNY